MKPTQLPLVIRAEHIRVETDRVPIGVPRPGPKVEVIRDGDAIRAIEVTCSCGERIRIECDYA